VTDLGATCCLLEYNNIEGFIASSDYSRKRIRSVKKLMRVGKQEVLQVLRVDEEKGYVDLSKKLLTPKDIESCGENYEKAKIVNGILRRLAETRGKESLLELYEAFGWGLFEVI
jgi:translation initiation factor 2 subunit 1